MNHVARRKLGELLADGHQVCGVMIARQNADGTETRGAVSAGGLVIWWHPEQAQQAPVAQGEPVAWLTTPTRDAHPGLERDVTFHRPPDKHDWIVQPLYTAQQQASEPMTDEQIRAGAFECGIGQATEPDDAFADGVRFAERHNGIGQP
jgi:hypothetical protein